MASSTYLMAGLQVATVSPVYENWLAIVIAAKLEAKYHFQRNFKGGQDS